MLAVVVTVNMRVWEPLPVKVTLFGLLGLVGLLNVQSAPAGRPAEQLPGLELVEGVKLMVCIELFTGAMVKVTDADCPAGIEAGDVEPALRVKSGATTVTVTGEDDEGPLIPL
jgi:hypothetical protein